LSSLPCFSQLKLDPIIYQKETQDAIKTKILLENPQLELPDDWTTINTNYFTIVDMKKAFYLEQKFVANLMPDEEYYCNHQVIDTVKNMNWYPLTSSKASSFDVTIRPTGKNFIAKIKYLNKMIPLDKGSIFLYHH
jgi:hypothetical protein